MFTLDLIGYRYGLGAIFDSNMNLYYIVDSETNDDAQELKVLKLLPDGKTIITLLPGYPNPFRDNIDGSSSDALIYNFMCLTFANNVLYGIDSNFYIRAIKNI